MKNLLSSKSLFAAGKTDVTDPLPQPLPYRGTKRLVNV